MCTELTSEQLDPTVQSENVLPQETGGCWGVQLCLHPRFTIFHTEAESVSHRLQWFELEVQLLRLHLSSGGRLIYLDLKTEPMWKLLHSPLGGTTRAHQDKNSIWSYTCNILPPANTTQTSGPPSVSHTSSGSVQTSSLAKKCQNVLFVFPLSTHGAEVPSSSAPAGSKQNRFVQSG